MIFSMGRLYRIIFLLVALIPAVSRAQTLDCEQTIALATEEFNAGHFYSVPSILNECLTKFNRDQRQRAFLLLTQTYLLIDDPIGAQTSYLEVLSANPEFIPDEQLHAIDIVYLSKRYTATPKFSWFVGAGSNISTVSVIRDLKVNENEKDSYSLRPGYQLGAGGEYSYSDNVKVRLETNFMQSAFRMSSIGQYNTDRSPDNLALTERQTWFNLPLYAVYSDNIGLYRPYGYAGYSVSKLFTDKANIAMEKLENTDGEVETIPERTPEINFLSRRTPLVHSIILGAGIRYKIGLDFVFVEARYSAGLTNFVDEFRSMTDPTVDQTSAEHVDHATALYGYGYRDNHARINHISLTFGFVRPLYKPRELKHVRTKGVLRKVKRSK
jgi:hypothetical protein